VITDAPPALPDGAGVPHGYWIVARTHSSLPYPCRCRRERCEGSWLYQGRKFYCDCFGRTDNEHVPPGCCSHPARAALLRAAGAPARPPAPSGHPETPEGPQRRPGVEYHCACATPWDTPPPELLLAPSLDGPVRYRHVLTAPPGSDVRQIAAQALDDHHGAKPSRWRQGAHDLLPAEEGRKHRSGWITKLSDGRTAVVDLPAEPRNQGVHCGSCHHNFANGGAFDLHKASWRAPCLDPRKVLIIESVQTRLDADGTRRVVRAQRGQPLLRAGGNGVWGTNPLAVWGKEGPPPGGV